MRFPIFCKSTSGVCFSDSARKMTQNGGRVVAIGSIFDMNIKAYVRNMEKMWTIELLMLADPNILLLMLDLFLNEFLGVFLLC